MHVLIHEAATDRAKSGAARYDDLTNAATA
jgi:hypothetical protein